MSKGRSRSSAAARWLPFATVALNLWWFACQSLAATNETREVGFREPRLTHYRIEIPPTNTTAQVPQPLSARKRGPAWIAGERRGGGTVEMGSRLVVQLEPGADLGSVVTNKDVHLARTVKEGLFILQAADSQTAINVAESLAAKPGVAAAYPVMRRDFRLHNRYAPTPKDPYFSKQWHLDNRGADGNLAGPDLNVRAAWPYARGAGVVVGVGDEGVQIDHPDLAANTAGNPHRNFYLGTDDGSPFDEFADHGTAVAGLIAAKGGNNVGISGVASDAGVASWVIYGTSDFTGLEAFVTDEELMQMFEYEKDRVGVQNHSWGSAATYQSGLEALSDSGIANAVEHGRGGKGVVIVRAGGNSRLEDINANDDGFSADPRVIVVAAVRKDGRACSYSTPGACLLISAPSGDETDGNGDFDPAAPNVYTTDQSGDLGYTPGTDDAANYAGFNGTSASSPQIAGVVALILSANTNLSYRDVQQILVHSARHFDPADPDIKTNGAGFRFSHNVGFGVPDAGFAVELARSWSNRPAMKTVQYTNTTTTSIPEDALRVVGGGASIPASLTNIRCLPSLGPHPDDNRSAVPLVYVGLANAELTEDLHGKAALIQRGTSFFYEKIGRAARAGAAFAVIFNNTGTTAIQAMGGTDYVPIPAVSIGKTDGELLRDFLASNPAATAKLQLTPTTRQFNVKETMICEHVGVRIKSNHTSRSDVRVTLVSPMGARSVMQAINTDDTPGPDDWTYWSCQHFYESSAGIWRLEVSDERNTQVQTGAFTSVPAIGSVTYAKLIIEGVPITDTDHDGLSDDWERKYFGSLAYGPKDDPDGDGYNNAREQIMGTDPLKSNSEFKLELAEVDPGFWRVSWPSAEGATYPVRVRDSLGEAWVTATNRPGSRPVSEYVIRSTNGDRFISVERR